MAAECPAAQETELKKADLTVEIGRMVPLQCTASQWGGH